MLSLSYDSGQGQVPILQKTTPLPFLEDTSIILMVII